MTFSFRNQQHLLFGISNVKYNLHDTTMFYIIHNLLLENVIRKCFCNVHWFWSLVALKENTNTFYAWWPFLKKGYLSLEKDLFFYQKPYQNTIDNCLKISHIKCQNWITYYHYTDYNQRSALFYKKSFTDTVFIFISSQHTANCNMVFKLK